MRLEFTKMHGLGNDFVVVDAWQADLTLSPAQLRHLAHRRLGVGCDQVLILRQSAHEDVHFTYETYNADGRPAGQCGNGVRCLARFTADQGYAPPKAQARTGDHLVALELHDNDSVSVDFGPPQLNPEAIPFAQPTEQARYALEVAGTEYSIAAVSLGNPHAVLTVPAVEKAPVHTLGPDIETHPNFPQQANVGFMEIVSRAHIRLRVWERGVGETRACGSGACAAMVAGRLSGELDAAVTVSLPGGNLQVHWAGDETAVILRGPAEYAYTGSIEL